jgi:hypothetical protein
VPYLSRLETVDLFGLNDPTIARSTPADVVPYVVEQRRPDLIALASSRRPVYPGVMLSASFSVDRALAFSSAFRARYVYVASWPQTGDGSYGLHLFARREQVQAWTARLAGKI